MGIERHTPSAFKARKVLPFTLLLVRSERVVCNPNASYAVAGHIELTVVRDHVRSNRNVCNIVEVPVQHILRYPATTTCAEHIVLTIPLEYGNVTGSLSAVSNFHRKRVAVAGGLAHSLGLNAKCHRNEGDRKN